MGMVMMMMEWELGWLGWLGGCYQLPQIWRCVKNLIQICCLLSVWKKERERLKVGTKSQSLLYTCQFVPLHSTRLEQHFNLQLRHQHQHHHHQHYSLPFFYNNLHTLYTWNIIDTLALTKTIHCLLAREGDDDSERSSLSIVVSSWPSKEWWIKIIFARDVRYKLVARMSHQPLGNWRSVGSGHPELSSSRR